MDRIQILVISPDRLIADYLDERLVAQRFDVRTTRPGAAVAASIRERPLNVAVVDRIEQRPDAAHVEITLLKEAHPKVRIIAISRNSSDRDAGIVEQGLFYYWTGKPRPALIDLVEAAADHLPTRKADAHEMT